MVLFPLVEAVRHAIDDRFLLPQTIDDLVDVVTIAVVIVVVVNFLHGITVT
jgi:hypothetical protein